MMKKTNNLKFMYHLIYFSKFTYYMFVFMKEQKMCTVSRNVLTISDMGTKPATASRSQGFSKHHEAKAIDF